MWQTLVIAAALASHPVSRAAAVSCLKYGADTVQITGQLARHTFYGAPNFGEDPKRDAREVGFYLDLAKPVCTLAGDVERGNDAKAGITRVQLVLDQRGYARLQPYLGRVVTLRGTLFGAITGHHHAPILLEVLKPVEVK